MYIKQIKQQQNGTGNAFNNTHLLLFDSQICSHFMTGKSYANQPDCRVCCKCKVAVYRVRQRSAVPRKWRVSTPDHP